MCASCSDGKSYLAWKYNKFFGNSFIEIQELEDDGIQLKNDTYPTKLLTASSHYGDHYCVEAPWFMYR